VSKFTFYYNIILFLVTLPTGLSLYSMELSGKKNIFNLPLKVMHHIFFSRPFNSSIKSFTQLSATCKCCNKVFTGKNFLFFYKANAFNKSEILKNLQLSSNYKNQPTRDLLLERTISLSIAVLTKTLLQDCGVKVNAQTMGKIPIFFYAKSLNVANVFIDHNVNIQAIRLDNGTNVLWEVIGHRYSTDLFKLYLERGVNPKNVSRVDNSCLLHEWAKTFQRYTFEMHTSFFDKGQLLFAANSGMINALDSNNQTPLDIAQKMLNMERYYEFQVTKHRLKHGKNLIHNAKLYAMDIMVDFYKICGGVTARELAKKNVLLQDK